MQHKCIAATASLPRHHGPGHIHGMRQPGQPGLRKHNHSVKLT